MNSVTAAVENIEAKVGLDDSAVATSIDYALKKGRHTSKQAGGGAGSVAYIFDTLNAHSALDKLLSLRSVGAPRFEVGGGGADDLYAEFSDGRAAIVAAAGKGRLRYNDLTKTFQTSVDGIGWSDVASAGYNGFRDLAFNDSVTGVTALLVGSVFFRAAATLLTASRAMIGTQAGGTATLRLRRFGTGVLVPGGEWSASGVGLQSVTLGAPVALPAADWYDIELVGDAALTISLVKGLYLEF